MVPFPGIIFKLASNPPVQANSPPLPCELTDLSTNPQGCTYNRCTAAEFLGTCKFSRLYVWFFGCNHAPSPPSVSAAVRSLLPTPCWLSDWCEACEVRGRSIFFGVENSARVLNIANTPIPADTIILSKMVMGILTPTRTQNFPRYPGSGGSGFLINTFLGRDWCQKINTTR